MGSHKNKIAIIIYKYDNGGVSKFIENLSKSLFELEAMNQIIAFENSTSKDINTFSGYLELANFIKSEKIETIIINGWWDHLKTYYLCKVFNIKLNIIQVLHSDLSQLGMGNRSIKGYIKTMLIKHSFNTSDTLVAASRDVQSEMNRSQFFKKEFSHIYNPVIDENITYSNKEYVDIENKSQINLVMIGWIRRIKGHDVAIKALSLLKDDRIRLNIIGGISDKEYYDELIFLIDDNKLKDRVSFLGVRENAIELLKNMDVLLLPSRTEALPTVLIEALACKVPSIASNCNHGPREILKDGMYGDLFEQDNYLELALRVKDLTTNNFKYNEFRKRSAERQKLFTYKEAGLEYLKLLKKGV